VNANSNLNKLPKKNDLLVTFEYQDGTKEQEFMSLKKLKLKLKLKGVVK